MLPRAEYLALPTDTQNRLMRAFVTYFGGKAHPPKRDAVARLAARPARADSGSTTLAGGRLHWRRETLFLGREAAAIVPQDMEPESRFSTVDLLSQRRVKSRKGFMSRGWGPMGCKSFATRVRFSTSKCLLAIMLVYLVFLTKPVCWPAQWSTRRRVFAQKAFILQACFATFWAMGRAGNLGGRTLY